MHLRCRIELPTAWIGCGIGWPIWQWQDQLRLLVAAPLWLPGQQKSKQSSKAIPPSKGFSRIPGIFSKKKPVSGESRQRVLSLNFLRQSFLYFPSFLNGVTVSVLWQAGAVRIDGVDVLWQATTNTHHPPPSYRRVEVKELKMSFLRRNMAVVSQDEALLCWNMLKWEMIILTRRWKEVSLGPIFSEPLVEG